MITTFYPPYNFGGDGIFVHRLSNELARRGHYVDVIHCKDAYRFSARRDPIAAYDDHPQVTVHGLKSRAGLISPLITHQLGRPVFNAGRIRQILRKGFDVVHYHNISLMGGPKVLEYGHAVKLYTLHDYWLVCPTHVMFKFNRQPCLNRACILCGLVYKRPPQWWRYSGLLSSTLLHVDRFIAPSRFIQKIHQRHFPHIPITHIPNFAPSRDDVASTEKESPGGPDKAPYFLYAGRLEKLKGVQTLIPVLQRYPKAQLWIAGSGDYEAELRRLARGSGNIRFLGNLPYRQLEDLYRGAVAVIVPSLWFENMPLVILEAFKNQTPCIVRNLGAMPEIIGDYEGGMVYDTTADLKTAMDLLVSNYEYRKKLGLNGFRTVEKKWMVDVYLKQYFSLIHEISGRKAIEPGHLK